MKIIQLVIEWFMAILFNCLDIFFSKKKYYVFSSRAANDYADNSKFLFERFLQTNPEETFFYTKRKEVLKKIPKNGIYAYSLKGLYILLNSKVLIFTHGEGDFFPYKLSHLIKHRNRKLVNLFHAIAVKKLVDKQKINVKKITQGWDYFVVSSQFESEFIQEQYDMPEEKIIIMGQSRNDILIHKSDSTQIEKNGEKIILYAPTFRNSLTELFPFGDVDLVSLDQFLIKNKVKLMLRLHINEEKHYKEQYKSPYSDLKNIYFAGAKIYPSVNDILNEIDGVITDYSSIALDFLLLDRPIAYIPYDYEDYKIERGFSFDYFKFAAGEILKSQKDLTNFISNVKSDNDDFSDTRKRLKNHFHQYQDGETSERLYKFIIKL